jgi:hypothetical protein
MTDLERALNYDPLAGDRDHGGRHLRDRIVTARRDGWCVECLGEIAKGTRIRSLTLLWRDEGPRTYRLCHECTKAQAAWVDGDEVPLEARMRLRRKNERRLLEASEE